MHNYAECMQREAGSSGAGGTPLEKIKGARWRAVLSNHPNLYQILLDGRKLQFSICNLPVASSFYVYVASHTKS